MPSELFCLLGRSLSSIHFHLIEGERNAEEVYVGIQSRIHQPHETILLTRNQIPLYFVASLVYHCFFPCLFRSRRHDCTIYFTR